MQRLFSTFPGLWPGTGLCLLRISIACLIVGTRWDLVASSRLLDWGLQTIAELAVAGFLLIGVATPLAAGLHVIMLLSRIYAGGGDIMVFFQAGVSAALMMLGPGAWSIDAVLFGRKRIDIGRR